MKKIIFTTVLCILFVGTANAQGYIHTWKMGSLSWNDFVHKSALNGKYSYLEYYMGIKDEPKEVDGITYFRPTVYAYTSAEYSWADTNYRSEALLQYNQCAFDLIEIYRRDLEATLCDATRYEEDQLMNNTMRRLEEDLQRLEIETDQGNNTTALSQWQNKIRHILDSTTTKTQFSHTDASFRWGMSLGLGFSAVGGDLHRHFGNGIGMGMNFDMGLKRHFIDLGMYIGGSHCRDTALNVHNEYDDLYTGDELTVLNCYATYGYSVIDNNHIRLTPFVGWGLMGFYYTPDEGSSMGSGNGCVHFGVDFSHKFFNEVMRDRFSSSYMNGNHEMFTLDVRLYGTYNNFRNIIGAPQGFTVNLQVGIGILGGQAHVD